MSNPEVKPNSPMSKEDTLISPYFLTLLPTVSTSLSLIPCVLINNDSPLFYIQPEIPGWRRRGFPAKATSKKELLLSLASCSQEQSHKKAALCLPLSTQNRLKNSRQVSPRGQARGLWRWRWQGHYASADQLPLLPPLTGFSWSRGNWVPSPASIFPSCCLLTGILEYTWGV